MKYDLAVIGGGPAGLMAAGRAGELGVSVILLEKNRSLGVKLLMTGGGRCNLSNKIGDVKELVGKYGINGKFLFSALNNFGVAETVDFFDSRGVKLKTEDDGRIFPASDKAEDVLRALVGYLKSSQVEIKTNAEVKEIVKKGSQIEKIILAGGEEILASKYVICTGGKSYPASGSTGDGYKWLKKLGHGIVEVLPALTPIIIKDKIVKELEGLSLKNIGVAVYKDNKKITASTGEAIFTKDGLSGPLILNLSRIIGRKFPGKLKLRIDFYPALGWDEFDRQLQKDFRADNNKLFRNFLEKMLSPKLAKVILKLSNVNPNKQVNLISKEERHQLAALLKEFDLEIYGLAGFDRAMVSSGGVKLNEVDPKTLKSKLIDNLYLAGEVLDLDGPTGGYNLQICWSTGYRAGESAAPIQKS